MLHIIQQSPFTHNSLDSCLSIIARDDILLFIEDGVLATTVKLEKLHEKITQGLKVYALEADLLARGFSAAIPSIEIINYHQWVDLTTHHFPIQTWC